MNRQHQPTGDALSWLLEESDPNVRYLALRDLVDREPDDSDLVTARDAAYRHGPIPDILGAMHPEGYWVKPGAGYDPKYRSTVWSLMALAQVGAAAALDERIARACSYVLDHSLAAGGQFSITGSPSGTIDCLQGNLYAALVDLGCDNDRLDLALDWLARSITGEGVAPAEDRQAAVRYYSSKNCGPQFACGYNQKRSCAWGAIKAMLALARVPESRRTPLIRRAIQTGVEFLFSVDPALATYPGPKADTPPSPNWWKFGFPIFYVTDLLQNVEALVALGYGNDVRLSNALDLIRAKQDDNGRWRLEYSYGGKSFGSFGTKDKPNKWVTLRALRVLKSESGNNDRR